MEENTGMEFDTKETKVKMNRKIKVVEAAAMLKMSPQFVRKGLQQQRLPIGTAVKMSSIWTYNISPKLIKEYYGVDVEAYMKQ